MDVTNKDMENGVQTTVSRQRAPGLTSNITERNKTASCGSKHSSDVIGAGFQFRFCSHAGTIY